MSTPTNAQQVIEARTLEANHLNAAEGLLKQKGATSDALVEANAHATLAVYYQQRVKDLTR